MAVAVAIDTVAASNVAAGLGDERAITVPTWLTLLTGAGAVGASALLAALVTDRRVIDALHDWELSLALESARSQRDSDAEQSTAVPTPPRWLVVGSAVGSVLGLLALGAVVFVGLEGPTMGTANFAVLLSFVGLRAVLPTIAFLLVDPWPTVDPFRTLANGVSALLERVRGSRSPTERRRTLSTAGLFAYPSRLRSWPAVIGLAALVWLELVLPVTTNPQLLAALALGYAGYVLVGSVLFSPAAWIRHADPLSTLFRLYGAVAPIQRRDGAFRLVVPGSRLRNGDVVTDASEIAFVVLLVWELTFNGFVVTPPGAHTIEALVGSGLPAPAAYLLVLAGGYALALGLYALATRASRRLAPTYLAERLLARRFAPPLLAIAAGYHLAHYVGFAISLAPATLDAAANPLSPPVNPTTLALPGWMGTLEIVMLLAGHLLAIWAAHAVAYDVFPGRLQAVRSQYPFLALMVVYTAVSLWLLTMPTTQPPYVAG
ncbi:hypothetical protein CV102_16445 [Natronococcus pandeyae]|uniref:Uncharacterized protein n=1 Tax=Natronococcus pandeyae TaxID=2055836 RepID=A0A8J8Q1C4_9EURY|nr:hypothetical protein CV102_16445 [Natronococcus pandeyae]